MKWVWVPFQKVPGIFSLPAPVASILIHSTLPLLCSESHFCPHLYLVTSTHLYLLLPISSSSIFLFPLSYLLANLLTTFVNTSGLSHLRLQSNSRSLAPDPPSQLPTEHLHVRSAVSLKSNSAWHQACLQPGKLLLCLDPPSPPPLKPNPPRYLPPPFRHPISSIWQRFLFPFSIPTATALIWDHIPSQKYATSIPLASRFTKCKCDP